MSWIRRDPVVSDALCYGQGVVWWIRAWLLAIAALLFLACVVQCTTAVFVFCAWRSSSPPSLVVGAGAPSVAVAT